jgi:hypothetical protein
MRQHQANSLRSVSPGQSQHLAERQLETLLKLDLRERHQQLEQAVIVPHGQMSPLWASMLDIGEF